MEFFHNKLSMNSLNLTTKYLQSKCYEPRISPVEGINHYATEQSVTAIIFKLTIVFVLLLL